MCPVWKMKILNLPLVHSLSNLGALIHSMDVLKNKFTFQEKFSSVNKKYDV